MSPLAAPLRALAQFDDPVFLGVVWRSVALSLLALAALAGGISWAAAAALHDTGWLGWIAAALSGIGALFASHFLFLPLATVVAFLFVDRVAGSVERRFYPWLPPGRAAPLLDQALDGIALGLRVLAWQVLAILLLLTPLAPIAAPLGWLVTAWSVGRGLFVTVAMRRMERGRALAVYREQWAAVLLQGGLVTIGSLVPLLNLFVPVLGTAAMVHLLHDPDRRRIAA